MAELLPILLKNLSALRLTNDVNYEKINHIWGRRKVPHQAAESLASYAKKIIHIERSFNMIYSHEVEMIVSGGSGRESRTSSDPGRGEMGVKAKEIKDISGFTHGVGWCAPQQGACKLTLNVTRRVSFRKHW